MSQVQHSGRAHARLNASSSHRWMACPPSVKLSEQFADTTSQYAEEGTYLHELCELKLHMYLADMLPTVAEQLYAQQKDNDFYTDEAETVTDEYVAFCAETIEAVRSGCKDPLILVEHRLDYSEYVPEGFGTGDLVIVADGMLEVIDFKGGRGVRVDAKRNSQLMLYGLGALLEFDPLYDIHTIRMTIVQPRLNNVTTYELSAEELLHWAETEVRPKAELAAAGEGEFCAGEHCRFCKARYTCRTRSEYHMALAQKDFKAPDLLTDEEILDILPVAESMNNWVQDLIAYATQQAVEGTHWQGYKLVAGRSIRKYTSEAEVVRAATEAGYTDIYKTSLLGIGELEKRLGKKAFGEVLGRFIIKPPGTPTLVPETDPRKSISTAEMDFT
ncbi:DUF2800 domain-containing protein [Eubacteriales bacterium OttesenSCG-928-A19]|nr:DUF2800 domain-containing protein [Eubacteriales bacterium OttesenSCG-928-A19]